VAVNQNGATSARVVSQLRAIVMWATT
jgi:hypothetical protein